MSRPRLVLATGVFPDRSRLDNAFLSLGIDFDVVSGIDIYTNGKLIAPENLVLSRARKRAETVSDRYEGCCIIGCDSVGWFGAALEKPNSRDEVHDRLERLSGSVCQYHTGICLINQNFGFVPHILEHFIQYVGMNQLCEEQIQRYLKRESNSLNPVLGFNPFDPELIKQILGDRRNLEFGIPIDRIAELVR